MQAAQFKQQTTGGKRSLEIGAKHTHPAGEVLVWEARIPMPSPSTVRYKYVVTEEGHGVVEEEPQERAVDLSKDMVDAGAVHLNDTWQVGTFR